VLLAVVVATFYRLYFGHGSLWDMACAAAGVFAILPVLLTAGNFLSLFFPTKFHVSMKRRDKLPFAASMLGVGAALLGSAPWAWALRLEGRAGPGPSTALTTLLLGALAWILYRELLPRAEVLLVARRERVLQAVIRE
jgi:ABC-2 type transport system permease protein